ncbi:MAG: DegT/DnrJ/EryC1/StrS family aminotransferase [Gammaproteobacteria bacterium]|nr:DegT/DnrJ/EryC1/StrS family aminotransferase [Gammaproteobacteria bacterium]MDH3409121.1 DegT/DnrJ/EryC1/StrS family aminotransferase [Gammaproteobacteria bacterium]
MAADHESPFIIFGAPDIHNDEIDEVLATLQSGWIGTGPKVARFEEEFADLKGVGHDRVAAVNSCTAALHVSMIAANLKPGDEVLTTAMTFCATANAIIHSGATPVPVDIDADTLNIDVARLEQHITAKTRAIVPVHFGGRPCDMDAIMAIAAKHGLIVIEDCAHAIETQWRGQQAGTFGDFGCFSFYVTKNVVTGEGGMVLARSPAMIDRIKTLALHGMSKDAWRRFGDDGYKHYEVVEAGFKYNMMDLQAALGIHQLRRVEENWLRRREIWKAYQHAFADLPLGRPLEPDEHMRHAYHLYTLAVDEINCGMSRDDFIRHMSDAGIGVGVHYRSLAQQPYYQREYGWIPENYPVSTAFGDNTVSLPLGPKLQNAEIDRIIAAVTATITK